MISIDPRTKILLLVMTAVFSVLVPNGLFTCIWIVLITLLGVMLGRIGKTLRAAIIFAALWLTALYLLPLLGGTLHTSLLVWLGLVFKCYPCCMLAGVIAETTKISEFMAAMAKWKVPRAIVIPIAIMFRYFPTVKEDWGHIKDSMALRGISISPVCFVRNPGVVIDAIYLPLLVTASKAADELTASAITRGIENPNNRTSRLDIRMRLPDLLVLLVFLSSLISSILLSAGGFV